MIKRYFKLKDFIYIITRCDLPIRIIIDNSYYIFTIRQLSSLIYNFGDYIIDYFTFYKDEIMIYLI